MKNEKPLKKRSWSTSRSRTCLLHTNENRCARSKLSIKTKIVRIICKYTLAAAIRFTHKKKSGESARIFAELENHSLFSSEAHSTVNTTHSELESVCCVCACESTFTNNRTDECWINIHFEFANTRKHTHIAHGHRYRRKRLMLWLAVCFWIFDLLRHSVKRIVMQKVMLLHVFHVMPMISIQWHVCASLFRLRRFVGFFGAHT